MNKYFVYLKAKALKLGFAKIKNGFTLIEILVVIGIIAILAAVVLVAINPGRQFAQARNSQRTSNLNAILNAIGQNIADNRGNFICAAGALPSAAIAIKSGIGGYDVRPCIIPDYIPEIPIDPQTGTLTGSTYDTGYTISQDAATKRIKVSATSAELAQTIEVVR
jgi:prepilin-type N-terminal cleavage/methylation domain-containing protein